MTFPTQESIRNAKKSISENSEFNSVSSSLSTSRDASPSRKNETATFLKPNIPEPDQLRSPSEEMRKTIKRMNKARDLLKKTVGDSIKNNSKAIENLIKTTQDLEEQAKLRETKIATLELQLEKLQSDLEQQRNNLNSTIVSQEAHVKVQEIKESQPIIEKQLESLHAVLQGATTQLSLDTPNNLSEFDYKQAFGELIAYIKTINYNVSAIAMIVASMLNGRSITDITVGQRLAAAYYDDEQALITLREHLDKYESGNLPQQQEEDEEI